MTLHKKDEMKVGIAGYNEHNYHLKSRKKSLVDF